MHVHVFRNSLAPTTLFISDVEDSNDDGFVYLTQLKLVRCGAFLSGEAKALFSLNTMCRFTHPAGRCNHSGSKDNNFTLRDLHWC